MGMAQIPIMTILFFAMFLLVNGNEDDERDGNVKTSSGRLGNWQKIGGALHKTASLPILKGGKWAEKSHKPAGNAKERVKKNEDDENYIQKVGNKIRQEEESEMAKAISDEERKKIEDKFGHKLVRFLTNNGGHRKTQSFGGEHLLEDDMAIGITDMVEKMNNVASPSNGRRWGHHKKSQSVDGENLKKLLFLNRKNKGNPGKAKSSLDQQKFRNVQQKEDGERTRGGGGAAVGHRRVQSLGGEKEMKKLHELGKPHLGFYSLRQTDSLEKTLHPERFLRKWKELKKELNELKPPKIPPNSAARSNLIEEQNSPTDESERIGKAEILDNSKGKKIPGKEIGEKNVEIEHEGNFIEKKMPSVAKISEDSASNKSAIGGVKWPKDESSSDAIDGQQQNSQLEQTFSSHPAASIAKKAESSMGENEGGYDTYFPDREKSEQGEREKVIDEKKSLDEDNQESMVQQEKVESMADDGMLGDGKKGGQNDWQMGKDKEEDEGSIANKGGTTTSHHHRSEGRKEGNTDKEDGGWHQLKMKDNMDEMVGNEENTIGDIQNDAVNPQQSRGGDKEIHKSRGSSDGFPVAGGVGESGSEKMSGKLVTADQNRHGSAAKIKEGERAGSTRFDEWTKLGRAETDPVAGGKVVGLRHILENEGKGKMGGGGPEEEEWWWKSEVRQRAAFYEGKKTTFGHGGKPTESAAKNALN